MSHPKVVPVLVSDKAKALEVVKALSDEYSRKIILSIISESLPIEEISSRANVPISTCYRRIHELHDYGIVRADKTIVQDDGKKFICYRSSFKNATIQLESGDLVVDLVSNRDPSDKLHDIWSSVKASDSAKIQPQIQIDSPASNVVPRKISPFIKT
ncbi:MAG: winged helix-turn-helix domain-containing protein [Thaumarchaeota archaeon]|nr:winged helix-turn-helix domain-containing protein [Nitrososphaerota archaeon]